MFTRVKKAAVPLLVLSGGIGAFMVLNAAKPVPETVNEPPRPISVFVEPAEQATTQLRVETHGEVRSSIASDIVTQVGGRIIEVSPEFIEGGRFEANEVLFVVEDADYQSAVEQARSSLASAELELQQALADADVARKQLAGLKNPSPLALKKPQVAQARAAIEAAKANLRFAQTNLERTRISLPYKGRIATTRVDLGQFVSPGSIVGRAFSTDKVEIRLPLTDTQLGALGVPFGFTAPSGGGLPVDLSASIAGKHYRWTGRVTRLDASIDPETRVVYATAVVDNPYDIDPDVGGMPLAVGLFVDAVVSGQIVENAIRIPSDGLRAGDRVFVLSEQGALDIRDVSVIYQSPSYSVLSAGVEPGENIIVSAIRNPIQGMKLQAIGDQLVDGGAVETLAD